MSVNRNEYEKLKRFLAEMPKKIEEIIVNVFAHTGETIINKIKDRPDGKPNWTDDTGNLRSSVGYIIYVGGKEAVVGGFDLVNNKGSNPSSGIDVGKSFAKKVALSINDAKYALVIAAGMNYAEWVEKKDYDVILFVEGEARDMVKKRLEVAFKNIEAEIKRMMS